MRKTLLLIFLPFFAHGQFLTPVTATTTFTFSDSDSLAHKLAVLYYPDTSFISIDTSGCTLWQIGNSLKPVFSNGSVTANGIMTDTLNPYPDSANDFFILSITNPENCIINFWHKYQTDSLHAGGIVEFSRDSATWLNVASCPGITVDNFYTAADTIVSGQPAFTGNSNGEQLSRFELMNCVGEKLTTTSCNIDFSNMFEPIYIYASAS